MPAKTPGFGTATYTTNPAGTTWVYPISLSAIASGAFTATLRGEVISVSSNDVSFPGPSHNLYLNDGAHTQPVDDHYWDGKSRYRFETNYPQDALRRVSTRWILSPTRPISWFR